MRTRIFSSVVTSMLFAASIIGCTADPDANTVNEVKRNSELAADLSSEAVDGKNTSSDSDTESTYTISEFLNQATAANPLIMIRIDETADIGREVLSILIFEDGTVREAFFKKNCPDLPSWHDLAKMNDSELIDWADQRDEMGEKAPYFLTIETDDSGNNTTSEKIVSTNIFYYFTPKEVSATIDGSYYFGLRNSKSEVDSGYYVRGLPGSQMIIDSPNGFKGLINPTQDEIKEAKKAFKK